MGAALAAMHFDFAAKAAPTINAVCNEKWNYKLALVKHLFGLVRYRYYLYAPARHPDYAI